MGGTTGDRGGVAQRALVAALCAIAALLAGASAAGAQERPSVVVDTTTPELAERESGGWTVDVTLINLTNEQLTLNSQPGDLDDTRCKPKVPDVLPPAQMSRITVKVPAVCKLTGERFEFEIDAENAAGDTVASVPFTASPGPDDESDRDLLMVFLIVLGIVAAAGVAFLLGWLVHGKRRSPNLPRTPAP